MTKYHTFGHPFINKQFKINYPEHLATAVKFTETQPAGTYFELRDGNYIICDPTYIHAGIGECMPQYRETSATIVRI